MVRQLTAKDRFARSLKAINEQCRRMRHWPLREQHRRLCRMLQGALTPTLASPATIRRLSSVVHRARRIWRKWLSRRSWKSHVTWEKFLRLCSIAFRYRRPASSIATPFVSEAVL